MPAQMVLARFVSFNLSFSKQSGTCDSGVPIAVVSHDHVHHPPLACMKHQTLHHPIIQTSHDFF
jgi:hypothetical protein